MTGVLVFATGLLAGLVACALATVGLVVDLAEAFGGAAFGAVLRTGFAVLVCEVLACLRTGVLLAADGFRFRVGLWASCVLQWSTSRSLPNRPRPIW